MESAGKTMQKRDEITVERVRVSWERIRQLIRHEREGAKMAALLSGCVPVLVEQEKIPPRVVIQARAVFHARAIQPYVDQGIIARMIAQVMGQACQVRVVSPEGQEHVSNEDAWRGGEMALPMLAVDVPLRLEEIQAHWMQLVHALAGLQQGQTLALALVRCVPVALQTHDVPALLLLETHDPSAFALARQAVQDGTLPVALLPVLGRVCLVRVELRAAEQHDE